MFPVVLRSLGQVMTMQLRKLVANDARHDAVDPLGERRVSPRKEIGPSPVRANSSIAVDREVAPVGGRGRFEDPDMMRVQIF